MRLFSHVDPNRLAEEGEDLVAHRFPAGPVAFASPRDLPMTESPQVRPRGFWPALKEFCNPPRTSSVISESVRLKK